MKKDYITNFVIVSVDGESLPAVLREIKELFAENIRETLNRRADRYPARLVLFQTVYASPDDPLNQQEKFTYILETIKKREGTTQVTTNAKVAKMIRYARWRDGTSRGRSRWLKAWHLKWIDLYDLGIGKLSIMADLDD